MRAALSSSGRLRKIRRNFAAPAHVRRVVAPPTGFADLPPQDAGRPRTIPAEREPHVAPPQTDPNDRAHRAVVRRAGDAGRRREQRRDDCTPPKYPGSGYFTGKIRVTNVSCTYAKKFVVAYYKCRIRNGGADGRCRTRVIDFRCKETRNSIPTEIDARVTCNRGRSASSTRTSRTSSSTSRRNAAGASTRRRSAASARRQSPLSARILRSSGGPSVDANTSVRCEMSL